MLQLKQAVGSDWLVWPGVLWLAKLCSARCPETSRPLTLPLMLGQCK